jgi:hypothetical protein
MIVGERTSDITVCQLIPNAKDGNRWFVEMLSEARKRDEDRAKRNIEPNKQVSDERSDS